jgi:hypothetical protein
MSEEQGLALTKEIIQGLYRAGLLKDALEVGPATVLLGNGSPLDSLAFVTFISDLEDRLCRETGRELSLILSDIHDYNANVTYLDAATMARYLAGLTNAD